MTIYKEQFIKNVSERTGITQKDTAQIVNAVFDEIADELAGGASIQITGFGTFDVRARKARRYTDFDGIYKKRNATLYPYFKAGDVLKRRIRGERI